MIPFELIIPHFSKKAKIMTQTETTIDFTRINNDVNGNPRYVCHFYALINEQDRVKALADQKAGLNSSFIDAMYQLACKRANKLGGKKFHNKQFGGGIVFQSYNIADTERHIHELMATL